LYGTCRIEHYEAVPARIEQTAERAHHLVETGEVVAARAVLREALAAVEPDPAHASPSLATAAMLYARVLVTLGDPGTARRWAAYAHTASRRLYGAGDERTLQAASVLAGVLYRAGAYSRSAHLYRELVNQLSSVDGSQALAAQADLATVLHARGDCAEARRLLEQTWRAYRHRYGEDHPLGLKMLARLGVMERSCGLPARERFALAEALCRHHLPPGHRLTAQIGILARTPPDRRHTCSEPLALDGERDGIQAAPSEPALPEPALPEPAPVAPAPREPALSEAALSEAALSEAALSEAALPEPAPPGPPAAPPEAAPLPVPIAPLDDLDTYAPDRRWTRRVLLVGLAVVIVTVFVVATRGLIALAGSKSDNELAQPTPASVPAAQGGPVRSPEPNAGTVSPAAAESVAPSDTAGPSGPPTIRPAAAPAAPTAVRLTDTRTELALAWVYPAGARGSVVISAGRPGQPRHTIQTLPAGSTQFTVYGLATQSDFCFGVGVAYSASMVKTAPAVCTNR
jgi:Tetratricopeptide repeat